VQWVYEYKHKQGETNGNDCLIKHNPALRSSIDYEKYETGHLIPGKLQLRSITY